MTYRCDAPIALRRWRSGVESSPLGLQSTLSACIARNHRCAYFDDVDAGRRVPGCLRSSVDGESADRYVGLFRGRTSGMAATHNRSLLTRPATCDMSTPPPPPLRRWFYRSFYGVTTVPIDVWRRDVGLQQQVMNRLWRHTVKTSQLRSSLMSSGSCFDFFQRRIVQAVLSDTNLFTKWLR